MFSLWLRAIELARELALVRVLRAGEGGATDGAAGCGTPRAGEDTIEGGADGV